MVAIEVLPCPLLNGTSYDHLMENRWVMVSFGQATAMQSDTTFPKLVHDSMTAWPMPSNHDGTPGFVYGPIRR